jgi:hypothetical protein
MCDSELKKNLDFTPKKSQCKQQSKCPDAPIEMMYFKKNLDYTPEKSKCRKQSGCPDAPLTDCHMKNLDYTLEKKRSSCTDTSMCSLEKNFTRSFM